MEIKRISAIGIIVSLCGTLTYLIFRSKVKKSYDDGWFSGFAEAARDYDKEIRSMQPNFNKAEKEI